MTHAVDLRDLCGWYGKLEVSNFYSVVYVLMFQEWRILSSGCCQFLELVLAQISFVYTGERAEDGVSMAFENVTYTFYDEPLPK